MTKGWRCRALALAALSFISCDRPVSPPAPGDLSLQLVSGDGQSGGAGEELPNPLVVKVTTPGGGPVRGQVLNFRVVAGGGSVFGRRRFPRLESLALRWPSMVSCTSS